jgi:UDP-N-acetylmuramoyl-tripeptide--D-alanyl-D-alanine ligase
VDELTAGELAGLCEGTLISGDPDGRVLGVSIDSRAIEKGEAFFAIKGKRFDGHDFASAALERGAACVVGLPEKLDGLAVAAEAKGRPGACLIGTDDPLEALRQLAQNYRVRLDAPIVAVTGSCGKTTTKDMLAAILGRSRRVVATEGNLNNQIGAPLMLLRAGSETEVAVLEIASNNFGEIEALARTLSPTAGIITNIGPVHLEGFGSIEGVFREKTSLVPHIRPGGFLVVNEKDVPPDRVRPMFDGEIITFGLEESADFFATDIRHDIESGTRFLLNGGRELTIPVAGGHNVENALAAAAAATALGADIDEIRAGLESFSASAMRMEVGSYKGATIINDAYNANPRAMRESISTVIEARAERRILALGDMLEMGEQAAEEHRSLGRYVGQGRIDLLYACGEFAGEIVEGAVEAGMQAERACRCADTEEIAISLRYILREGDILLVKGSRGMQMERVVQLISEEEQTRK